MKLVLEKNHRGQLIPFANGKPLDGVVRVEMYQDAQDHLRKCLTIITLNSKFVVIEDETATGGKRR